MLVEAGGDAAGGFALTMTAASHVQPVGQGFTGQLGVFDDDQIDSFIELKMQEVMRFEMTPHPVEFDMYYSA